MIVAPLLGRSFPPTSHERAGCARLPTVRNDGTRRLVPGSAANRRSLPETLTTHVARDWCRSRDTTAR